MQAVPAPAEAALVVSAKKQSSLKKTLSIENFQCSPKTVRFKEEPPQKDASDQDLNESDIDT